MSKADLKPNRFENRGLRWIAGVQQKYTAQTMNEIPLQWQYFVPTIPKIPARIGNFTAYGVVFGLNDPQGFGYLSGVEVSDVSGLPGEFTSIEIPALRYAIFPHEGHVMGLKDTVSAIVRDWFPASDCKPARQGTPAVEILERYGDGFDPQTGMGDMEIWVPIKA